MEVSSGGWAWFFMYGTYPGFQGVSMIDEENPVRSGASPLPGASVGACKKILVVDDDDTVREALKEFLEFHDFAVTAVDGAARALECVGANDFDLVISDLVMPKMDGIALIKAIREAGKSVPLLVMTGFASIEYAVESMKAGATDFITKPLKFDHIMLIVNRILETSALRQMAL